MRKKYTVLQTNEQFHKNTQRLPEKWGFTRNIQFAKKIRFQIKTNSKGKLQSFGKKYSSKIYGNHRKIRKIDGSDKNMENIQKIYENYGNSKPCILPSCKRSKNMGKIPEIRKNTENTKRIWKIQMIKKIQEKIWTV